MCIYLVRHGESVGNRDGVFSGVLDHPLTKEGRRQAAALGDRFRGMEFALVLTSQLERAKETADLLLHSASIAPARRLSDARLNERNFGCYEGVKFPALEPRRTNDARWRTCYDIDFVPLGGESMAQTHRCAVDYLESFIFAHADDGDILVVSHGNVLRSMTLHFLGWPLELLPEMPSRNCLVTRLRTTLF